VTDLEFRNLVRAFVLVLGVAGWFSAPLLFGQETEGSGKVVKPIQDDQAKQKEPFTVKIAEGTIQFTVPGVWEQVKPQSNVIDVEIKIARLEKDQPDGRLTISGAGGTIEANLERWKGQFSENTVDPKLEIKSIAGQRVFLIDLTGTFVDAPGGPFSNTPKVERKDYRMLGAIIQTSKQGNYFLKFYGPKKLIDDNQKFFQEMIDSLKVSES
jgi:hypothetical protein